MPIRINVSDRAAASESRDLDPVPTGKYLATVDKAEVREVASGDNTGETYMALELVITEPATYEGRRIWTNVMLFGEAFSAVWIAKAMGIYNGSGPLDFPEPGDLLGEQFVIRAVKVGETRDKKDPDKVYPPKNEVKGYWNRNAWKAPTTSTTPRTTSTSASVLP